ncbi:MAG: transposase [Burkholderiales bacterium]
MAMGKRCDRVQQEELFYASERAAAPGHPFYERLNRVLEAAGFDAYREQQCERFYHHRLGRPSLAPGVYFRLLLIGFFEGLDSERGIAWRVADSWSLRQFLHYGMHEATPDHVTVSRTRRLLDEATHQAVFQWVLREVARRGLLKGKTVGIDATTLEANAAMKSIVRRDTGESYREYLRRLAAAAGLDAADEDAVRQMDRKRKKKTSNEDWLNPHDPEAEITKRKDGTTHLAYKAEQAVDLETGAIVAVTTHGGAVGDTESVQETLPAAGEAVAEQMATATLAGDYGVHEKGLQEVVADKGYHSGAGLALMSEMGVRTYISAPRQPRRKWEGKRDQQAVVYANRRRVEGARGKRLLRRRGEYLERPFAHQYETGAMRRVYLRGRSNVAKRVLLQAAACNLALLLRTLSGAGTPKGLADLRRRLFFALWRVLSALTALPDAVGRLSVGQKAGFIYWRRRSRSPRRASSSGNPGF